MVKRRIIKRIVAGLLCCSFAFAYVPEGVSVDVAKFIGAVKAAAAAVDNGTTEGSSSNVDPTTATSEATTNDPTEEDPDEEESGSDQYSVTADEAIGSYDAYGKMEEWRDRKTYKAPDNTYMITVSTGATAGKTVLYLGIRYRDVNGQLRTQYVFPAVDAYDRSKAMLDYYADGKSMTDTYGKKLAGEYGYSEDVKPVTSIDSWSVIDYAFQTVAEIKSVESVDIYMETGKTDKATGARTKAGWTAQGISIYKVDEYKGYEEYGIISGQHFLDIKGYLIADVQRTDSSTLTTSGQDKIFAITSRGNSAFKLISYSGSKRKKKDFAGESDMCSLRMDFADTLKGGLESFTNPEAVKVGEDMGIVEDIAVEIQYQDTHKWTRKVTLPVVLSSYGMIAKKLKGEVIYGFGLRGDTIAFEGIFPDYSNLLSSVVYVGDSARNKIAENGITLENPSAKATANLKKTQSDAISITGISLYKGGCTPYLPGGTDSEGKKLKGATVEYVFGNENPMMYYTTTEDGGRDLGDSGKNNVTLIKYNEGNPLLGTNAGEGKYLVTVETANQDNAGTTGDISMKFYYKNSKGAQQVTSAYNIRKAAASYMGKWATAKDGDFVEESGFVPGGKIKFVIDADDAYGFTGMQLSLDNADSWVLGNTTIAYMESFSKRRAYLKDVKSEGSSSNYWLEREEIAGDIMILTQTRPIISDDSAKKLDINDVLNNTDDEDDNDSGMGVKKDVTSSDASSDTTREKFKNLQVWPNRTYTISFDSNEAIDVREVDYASVRYKMSYEQTEINWGFMKARKKYNIGVNVAADDIADVGNGDAGSSNHFYFQLVFANGNSAYVLANQQMTSDGFRSGVTERFSICTNQDYGKIKGIRIIPEDLSSKSDPFDKLNIDSIVISEDTNGGCYVSYVIDDVGWIDIEYYDEEEKATLRGREGRTQNEIAKYYPLSYTTTSVKVLCELTLGGLPDDVHQFVGNVKADIDYTDKDGASHSTTMDVVRAIADYNDIKANAVESTNGTATVAANNADGVGYTSVERWMFRPNHTDRFTFDPIPNLKRIDAITFSATSQNNMPATWNIKSVSLSQVVSDGGVQISANDEMYRNMNTIPLCTVKPEDGGSQYIESVTAQAGQPAEIGPIEFPDHEFEWTSTEWVTPVTRTPESTNDTLNVYLYPSTSSYNQVKKNEKLGSKKKSVTTSVVYELPYSQYLTTSSKKMFLGKDGSDNYMYYYKGLEAKNMINLGAMYAYCADDGILFNHAIVQQVRDGVVMGTYTYTFMDQSGTMGGATGSLSSVNAFNDNSEEELYIALDEETKEQSLVTENNDIAISFFYTSTIDDKDDVKTTYQSPYIYLTDVGYTKINGGMFLKVPADIPFVKEITGFTITAYGIIKGRVNGAAARVFSVDEAKNRTKRSFAGFNRAFDLSNKFTNHKVTSTKLYGAKSVMPVEITFTTKSASMSLKESAKSAISMSFNYTDYNKAKKAVFIDDVTKFITSGDAKRFVAGEQQTIRFFIPEMSDKPNITSADIFFGDTSAYWSISDVNVVFGFDEMTIGRAGEQMFSGSDDESIMRFNNIRMTTQVSKGDELITVKNGEYQFVAKYGDIISGTVTIDGTSSKSGATVRVYRMVGDAPDELTGDELTTTKNTFAFTVPKNKTGEIVRYKIEVTSVDDPTLVDVIWVTVESTTDSETKTNSQTPTTERLAEDPGDSYDPDSE